MIVGTPYMLQFSRLRLATSTRQKLIDPQGVIDMSYRGNELAGEVGEACNLIKKLERERLGMAGSRTSLGALMEELADVVICVDLIAGAYKGNLAEAIAQKFDKTSRERNLDVFLGEL